MTGRLLSMALAALAFALAAPGGRAEPPPTELFERACLETLPSFARAGAVFEAAGLTFESAKAVADGGSPAHTYHGPGVEYARVRLAIPEPDGPRSECAVQYRSGAGPDGDTAVAAIGRAVAPLTPAGVTAPDCIVQPGFRMCLWLWSRPGGCNGVGLSELNGEVFVAYATSFDTGGPCKELPS